MQRRENLVAGWSQDATRGYGVDHFSGLLIAGVWVHALEMEMRETSLP